MEECVIDQLKTCITHMLKSQHKYRMDSIICLKEIIEQRDNALFFKSRNIADFITESYVMPDDTCVPRAKFNESDILFQEYLTKAMIRFTIKTDTWTILSFDEAYKLLALLKLEGY